MCSTARAGLLGKRSVKQDEGECGEASLAGSG